jgi:hypothetical protein
MSWEIGIRGLDITHGVAPRLADRASACGRGQAAVFWPNPSGDRLRAALGEVHPAEFCFDIFTGS